MSRHTTLLTPFRYDSTKTYPSGYFLFLDGVSFHLPPSSPSDGFISFCIDARIPISKILDRLGHFIPVSTAGNALPPELAPQVQSSQVNIVVTHGQAPVYGVNHPSCGGHQLVLSKEELPNYFTELASLLRPHVHEHRYHPFDSALSLGEQWKAGKNVWHYDHTTGWLHDASEQKSDIYLGISPSLFHDGPNPLVGQDPTTLVVNTTGVPFFRMAHGIKGKEVGGILEVHYPSAELPEVVVQSLLFAIQNQRIQRGIGQQTHFASSDLLLFVSKSQEELEVMVESILYSQHQENVQAFLSYSEDPKDLLIGVIPTAEESLLELTIH